jgi:hypothetical protein
MLLALAANPNCFRHSLWSLLSARSREPLSTSSRQPRSTLQVKWMSVMQTETLTCRQFRRPRFPTNSPLLLLVNGMTLACPRLPSVQTRQRFLDSSPTWSLHLPPRQCVLGTTQPRPRRHIGVLRRILRNAERLPLCQLREAKEPNRDAVSQEDVPELSPIADRVQRRILLYRRKTKEIKDPLRIPGILMTVMTVEMMVQAVMVGFLGAVRALGPTTSDKRRTSPMTSSSFWPPKA